MKNNATVCNFRWLTVIICEADGAVDIGCHDGGAVAADATAAAAAAAAAAVLW